MELIKTPSFNAMDSLSDILSKQNKGKKYSTEFLHSKISLYLVKSGSRNFVELYNDVVKNKNYEKAFLELNLS